MADAFEYFLQDEQQQLIANNEKIAQAEEAIAAILADASDAQRAYILDDREYVSARCPRRSGKTWANMAKALVQQLRYPGSRILIVSLTLKSTRENYWQRGPAGVFAFNRKYKLGITFNHTDSVWTLPNGSSGRLAGAETRADIEYLRGAAAEAHGALVDECKSFAPAHLQELIEDVLEPGLMTYQGWMALTGTPGFIPMGPFYEATQPWARNKFKATTCVPYEQWDDFVAGKLKNPYIPENDEAQPQEGADEDEIPQPWSHHYWTIKDNDRIINPRTGIAAQWAKALRVKAKNRWADDHPTWLREYLGLWTSAIDGMVYEFLHLKLKDAARVTWEGPQFDKDTKKVILDPDDGPWFVVMGLDLGFVDDTAIVVCAYSAQTNILYQLHEEKHKHLLVDDVAALVIGTIEKFGIPTFIVGDMGAQGKMIVETINQRYGLAIEPAEKQFKPDFIELLNADFSAGLIRVIADGELDKELCGLQWALGDKDKQLLARTNKLKEDPLCPNHLCDALLYLWRFSYHFWSARKPQGLTPGTPEWELAKEKEAEEKLAHMKKARVFSTDNLPSVGLRPITRNDLWRLTS
jgi:hypothetical protein